MGRKDEGVADDLKGGLKGEGKGAHNNDPKGGEKENDPKGGDKGAQNDNPNQGVAMQGN